QLGETRNQANRQVVDAVVAEVLKGLQDGGLSRTAHSGNDYQFTLPVTVMRGFVCKLASGLGQFLGNSAKRHLAGMLAELAGCSFRALSYRCREGFMRRRRASRQSPLDLRRGSAETGERDAASVRIRDCRPKPRLATRGH